MKKITKVLLTIVAITICNINTTDAAFPVKQAAQETVVTNSTTANAQVIEQASTTHQIKEATSATRGGGGKSKIVAALLAFFLGTFGVHSFYMGNKKKGLIQLLLGLGGFILTIIGVAGAAATATTTGATAGLGLAAIGYILLLAASIWAFVDFIRILIGNLEPESGFND